jgi:hypothetical protein
MRAYFAEIHALHSFTTQRRTNRRRGRRLARADYQLDNLVFLDRFLGHGVGFLMVATPSWGASEVRNREWRKVSSLGVSMYFQGYNTTKGPNERPKRVQLQRRPRTCRGQPLSSGLDEASDKHG